MRQNPTGARLVEAAPCLLRWTGLAILIVLVTAWAWLLLVEVSRGSTAAACLNSAFRDPVTGREQGIGPVRVQPDGTIICSGGILHRVSR